MCGIIALKYKNNIKGSQNNEKNEKLRNKVYKIFLNQISRGIRGAGMSVKTLENKRVQFYRARSEDATHFFKKSKEKFSTLKKGDLVLLHHRTPTTNNNGTTTTHPLMNEANDISLIHNGMISNYKILHEELTKKGHEFETLTTAGITDSEVILHAFEEGLEGKRTKTAIIKSLTKLHDTLLGSFAIAITMRGSENIWLTANSNPIEVYKDRYATYASSELPKNSGFTTIKTLEDGEIGYIGKHGYETIKVIKYEYPEYNDWNGRSTWGCGITDDDTDREGFKARGKQLDEELTRELINEREELKCYTELPTMVDDMLSDFTDAVLETKELGKKKRAGYLIKHVEKITEHFGTKFKDEAQKTEEMMVSYEEHIDKIEEVVRELKTKYKELEIDYAEDKANMFEASSWEEYNKEMEALNDEKNN